MGLTVEEATLTAEVWPDNLQAVNAFVAMSTQWRVGASGATGLDYGALPDVLRLINTPQEAWPDVFDSIRIMEDSALETMRKKV